MKTTARLLTFSLLLSGCIISMSGAGHSQEDASRELQEFARRSLDGYVSNVLNEQNVQKLGFRSMADARQAKLGNPYRILMVELTDLKAYRAGGGAPSVLRDTRMFWFPVTIEGEVRSKLEILETRDGLVAGDFGGARSVSEIASVGAKLEELMAAQGIRTRDEVALVKVPALRATSFYVRSGEKHYLVPAMIQPQRYGLSNGRVYPADELLTVLQRYARDIDEDRLM